MEITSTDGGETIPADILGRAFSIYHNPSRGTRWSIRFAGMGRDRPDMFPDIATMDIIGTGDSLGEAISDAVNRGLS